jgi:glycosyltransferase involved in cell wall biosynthesis
MPRAVVETMESSVKGVTELTGSIAARSTIFAAVLDRMRIIHERAAARAERTRLAQHRITVPAGAPVLAYGAALTGGNFLYGGRVKLHHLQERFPESRESFNILYLVSSALPFQAAELARWAKIQGAKVVLNQNGVAYPAWAGWQTDWFNRPMRQLVSLADFVIYQSAFCKESADHFLKVAPRRWDILFNPVDCAAFSPARNPNPSGQLQLLTAGNHQQHEFYRLKAAVEAAAILRRDGFLNTLTIAGDIQRACGRDRVLSLANRAAVNVQFIDRYTQNEAPRIFQQAHIFLHTKWKDPCPTLVCEALACGLPVVGLCSGGMPELVGEDGGELISGEESWDRIITPASSELADAVKRIWHEWPQRSLAARQRAVRLFDKEQWVQRHAAILENVLADRSEKY